MEGAGFGLVVFAACLLGLIGCFNLIDGIAAIANSHVFVANAHSGCFEDAGELPPPPLIGRSGYDYQK